MREVIALILLLFGAGVADAESLFFDMGTEKSAVREGFKRVTAKTLYSKELGYGWRKADGLKEFAKAYAPQWVFSETRGRKMPPPMYTNEITEDMVYSDKPAEFVVDVPSGRYCVYVLSGRSAGSMRDYYLFDVEVEESAATIRIHGPRVYEKRLLVVEVGGGQLVVKLKPETMWLVAALLIYPESESARVRKETIAPLEQEVFLLPPKEWAKWKRIEHIETRPLPEPSELDRARGYMVYARHYLEVIYPNTTPRKEELNPTLRIFAAQGEYEPVTFTVYPLRDLKSCTVSATELKGAGVIPQSNIEIRSVRYMLARPNYSWFYQYLVVPDILDKVHPLDLKKGINQRYWITVKVPEDAAGGVYRGELRFVPQDSPPARIPLVVRVLPFKLKKNPEHIYSIYYRDPLQYYHEDNPPAANAYFVRKAELERRDMAEHGLNGHVSYVRIKDWDTFAVDVEDMQRRLEMDWKYGLNKEVVVVSFGVTSLYYRMMKKSTGSHLRLVPADVPQEFFDKVTELTAAIEAERKKRGLPEFLYYPIDEPSTQENSVRFMVNVLRAVKKAGVRTYVTADPTHEQFAPMWDYVDVWCCQPFVWNYEKIKRLSRERKKEFWCYPNHISGENDHTPVKGARMTWGFGFWRSGFRALLPWIYQANINNPFNYLDGSAMDFMNRSTPDGEPIPVALWEAYREGIDDGRYIYTLQTLIGEAKKSGSAERRRLAEQAEKDLQYVWNSINVQEKYKYEGMWNGEDFDAFRWLLAKNILALLDAG